MVKKILVVMMGVPTILEEKMVVMRVLVIQEMTIVEMQALQEMLF